MLARKCSKSFKLGFGSRWTENLKVYKLDLYKAEEPEINCQHPLDHQKSKRIPEKHLFLFCWLHQSLWLCRSQQIGKFLKRWEYEPTLPASWETCMQVKKQQLEWDMEQWTVSELGKEHDKAIYYPACLTLLYAMSKWKKLMMNILKHVYCYEAETNMQAAFRVVFCF